MKRISLIFLLGVLFSMLPWVSVNAEIYKWIDEKGTVNFTEDANNTCDEGRRK